MIKEFFVNGERKDCSRYGSFHDARMHATLAALYKIGAKRVIELGGHPWVMTAHMIESLQYEIVATVSAEEVSYWPDPLSMNCQTYNFRTQSGREASLPNYSGNLERQLFEIPGGADTVLACEIIEHLCRAPHVFMLNINRWLPIGGKVIITTPNGAQFHNPLRARPPFPAYRCHFYERHQYLHTMDTLVDLVESTGFRVVEASYWDIYRRTGLAQFYGLMAKLPFQWAKQRFNKTLFVVAEKTAALTKATRLPKCCIQDSDWEFVENMGHLPTE